MILQGKSWWQNHMILQLQGKRWRQKTSNFCVKIDMTELESKNLPTKNLAWLSWSDTNTTLAKYLGQIIPGATGSQNMYNVTKELEEKKIDLAGSRYSGQRDGKQ